jgi:hypothetical protein
LGLEGDALETELGEFFADSEEVAHVHAAGFEGCGKLFERLGNGFECFRVEGGEAGFEEGDAAQGGGEGVFEVEFRGAEAGLGFVALGSAFFDKPFLLVPNRERDGDGEAEELVGAEALWFVGVLIVGVLDTEADAFPGLGAGEC